MDKNLYDLPPEELKDVPTVCGSLREAIGELEADHAFLTKGDVFTRDQIEILHRAEVGGGLQLRAHPAPDRVRDVLFGLSLRHRAKAGAGQNPAPSLLSGLPAGRSG